MADYGLAEIIKKVPDENTRIALSMLADKVAEVAEALGDVESTVKVQKIDVGHYGDGSPSLG